MDNISGTCVICDATNELAEGTVETEIINCFECDNRLVVTTIVEQTATLEEAPEIEEDWGE